MREDVEQRGVNEDAGERCRRNLGAPVQIARIYARQAVASFANQTAQFNRLIAVKPGALGVIAAGDFNTLAAT